MSWAVEYTEAAKKDLRKIGEPVRTQVLKAIAKVSANPDVDGYGKPLGNKAGSNLSGLYKVKLRSAGIRVVYQLIRNGGIMKVVVVGIRSDDEVYKEAARRLGR